MADPKKPPPPPFAIQPLCAAELLDHELARRNSLARRGNMMTGCEELDKYVLLGGFQRGSVVGVSAEEDEMGLVLGLQTAARLLVAKPKAKVLVVTTLPVTVLLPRLKEALVERLGVAPGGMLNIQGWVMGCLERIEISRVFDVQGLEEVLGELGEGVPAGDVEKVEAKGQGRERTEVRDSEDEESLSSPSPPQQPDEHQPIPARPTRPDMVLITHTSTLFNALFTGRDKDTAHATMQSLASRLQALTRPSPTGASRGDEPLIMLLNSTTSSLGNASSSTTQEDGQGQRHTEPQTLTSIFNPLPPKPTPASTSHPNQPRSHQPNHQPQPPPPTTHNPTTTTPNKTTTTTIPNKPSFGQVFAQLLDMHLLLSRVPQTTVDRAVLAVNPTMRVEDVEYVWVAEVLLDEIGAWQPAWGGDGGGKWRGREQRWGVFEGGDGDGLID
ncbi:hypothetical protein C8A05DRAFT_47191 [Staphylotrichum tortipilum]|uniref:Uncharacterized protein n=1 Tax=Staphylotrichum tortipilum TaxID=2831512 RepID=A0AAN6RPS9_9PEZI|nr:hypothetical protein C8A05DRAFT_47191 [Staphylotrichum longicolle]